MKVEIRDRRETGRFEWRWPEEVEHFDSGVEGRVIVGGRSLKVRWGLRQRTRFGSPRQAGVLWLSGLPVAEAVAADDYEDSSCLVSVIRRGDRKHARSREDVPPGYEGREVVVHSAEVTGKYSPNSLALKAHKDDLESWVAHGLIKRGLGARATEPPGQSPKAPAPAPRAAAVAPGKPGDWQLWQPGKALKVVEGLQPLLASWESRVNPAQIRLQAYLDEVERACALGELPVDTDDLFLHMDIDVVKPERLLRHYDLENYLTPVVQRLGARRFRLVSATKRVGEGSRLVVGRAEPRKRLDSTFERFSSSPLGTQSSTAWKHSLRDQLLQTAPRELDRGPVEVHLAWQASRSLNWVNLWKPTGDAMGPVLGAADPLRPFHLNDDRITRLHMHLDILATHAAAIRVGMWWRPEPSSPE